MKSARGQPMRHVLGPEGDAALVAALRAKPLLAFDFDGTLAPIVANPALARVPVAIRNRIQRLRHWFPVAIVSGRSLEDLRTRLDFPVDFMVGNHGAEREFPPALETDPAEIDAFRTSLASCREQLAAAGVSVEDKGLSITLHYRLARDKLRALALIDAVVPQASQGLRVLPGKMVVNIVQHSAPDKGQAMLELAEQAAAGCAIYVGDDANDEPVFAAARQNWVTVRVGREEPSTQAAFFLDTSAEVALLLDRMVRIREEVIGQAPP